MNTKEEKEMLETEEQEEGDISPYVRELRLENENLQKKVEELQKENEKLKKEVKRAKSEADFWCARGLESGREDDE